MFGHMIVSLSRLFDDHLLLYCFLERVGAEVVECACVIELPELKVSPILTLELFFIVYAALRTFLECWLV